MSKPYIDIPRREKNEWIRVFDSNMNSDELVWHRDRKTRDIKVLCGTGWKFQRDNEIPFNINSNNKFQIESMVYHRIIKGDTPLVIKIKEKENDE